MAGYAGYIWIDYILIFGMILGGTNFLIHYRLWRREWKALIDNIEMRYWWIFIAGFTLLILAERAFKGQFAESLTDGSAGGFRLLEENFRLTLFQVVSIITTTGFGTRDIGSSFSGMFSALGNIGPCYIPVAEMNQLHPVIKIVYIFGMLAGRLEVLPVLLLFNRRAW